MSGEMATANKTCFVVMGFGKKTDFETGRVLDLDKSYINMIKPAVEAAGYNCIRADEIVHSGLIDAPMYDQLLKADIVVADLSTSNKNAFYELGVRHALRPFTTIIIAEDGFKIFPFDVNHTAIRQYHHLGEDIGFGEAVRFSQLLTAAIKEIARQDPRDKDSPVYTFLNQLIPPEMTKIAQAKVEGIAQAKDQDNSPGLGIPAVPETLSILMSQVDAAQGRGDWATAKTLLSLIRQTINENVKKTNAQADGKKEQEDPYILQRLALVTYKSKLPTEKEALLEAHQLLNLLDPGTSNDTETLGLWGAVHKRLWELEKNIKFLDECVRAYERGFYIKNDYYNGINYAYVLNVRATWLSDHAEAIADFIQAQRVRREVLSIAEKWLEQNPMPKENDKVPPKMMTEYLKNWYWVKATIGEAYIGLDDKENGDRALAEAYAKAPETWMKASTEEQIARLINLLENSPLKYLKDA